MAQNQRHEKFLEIHLGSQCHKCLDKGKLLKNGIQAASQALPQPTTLSSNANTLPGQAQTTSSMFTQPTLMESNTYPIFSSNN